MPMEKQKLNTLNKLIDSGANTEKKITAMGIQEIIAVPKITVPEIHIITELQNAIKSRSVIAYLAAGDDEPEPEETSKQSENDSQITETDENTTEETTDLNEENEESEVQNHGRFHF